MAARARCLVASLALAVASGVFAPPRSLKQVVDVRWSLGKRRLTDGGTAETHEELDVTFEAGGQTYEVQLQLNRALLPTTARHWLRNRLGHVVGEGPMPPACFYTGGVVGDTNSTAGLSTCNGGITGIVVAHGNAISVTPETTSGTQITASGGSRHLAAKIEDEVFADYVSDIARFAKGHGVTLTPKERRLTGATTKYVEAFVANDFRRYEAFGGQVGLPDLATHSVAVMNAVTAIYRNPPANGASFPYTIQVVFVGQHTFLNGDPWENAQTWTGDEVDSSVLLDSWNEWGQEQLEAMMIPHSDNRILLSGHDFDGPTVGLAGVSTMCYSPRSGNINMCLSGDSVLPMCAAIVAHEVGHNFGMMHDSSGNACPESGLIMNAVLSDPPTQFSECSAAYITDFFATTYGSNGECLENMPERVEGSAICGNGFVEDGEDCDCGAGDCTGLDSCCDGSTCKFADPFMECSDLAGPCCSGCMLVPKDANQECRPAAGVCDLPEYCTGESAQCEQDRFAYPGIDCYENGFVGQCSAGTCMSTARTCGVDITRDFSGTWDASEPCDLLNDQCKYMICHNASETAAHMCGQSFSTHGKQMTVPDGMPCWYPGHARGERKGLCYSGACHLPHTAAVVPLCGNGGIDFGEECDCGSAAVSSCCNCETCTLQAHATCSYEQDKCCDSTTCAPMAAGTICRGAISECDVEEVCDGSSPRCPRDEGAMWGTPCTDTNDGSPSTCYGKECLPSLSSQCQMKYGDTHPFGYYYYDRTPSDFSTCQALACCEACDELSGNYDIGGTIFKDPLNCNGCTRLTSSHTFTSSDGTANVIYQNAPVNGRVLADPTKFCYDYEMITPAANCSEGFFLERAVGQCLPCDASCNGGCSGPTQFDCLGGCKFGSDSRGACAISLEQWEFVNGVGDGGGYSGPGGYSGYGGYGGYSGYSGDGYYGGPGGPGGYSGYGPGGPDGYSGYHPGGPSGPGGYSGYGGYSGGSGGHYGGPGGYSGYGPGGHDGYSGYRPGGPSGPGGYSGYSGGGHYGGPGGPGGYSGYGGYSGGAPGGYSGYSGHGGHGGKCAPIPSSVAARLHAITCAEP